MNRIEVYFLNNGNWESIKGKANVVNFTNTELLDEALDEARLVIKNSAVDFYAPTLDVKIEFYEDNALVDTIYYIIANPKRDIYATP